MSNRYISELAQVLESKGYRVTNGKTDHTIVVSALKDRNFIGWRGSYNVAKVSIHDPTPEKSWIVGYYVSTDRNRAKIQKVLETIVGRKDINGKLVIKELLPK